MNTPTTHTYPAGFEEKTGFDQLREMLLGYCYGTLGEKVVAKIGFSTDKTHINKQLNETEEFRQILLSGESFPGSNYFDPTEVFSHLKLPETFVEPETLLELKLSLETILQVIRFLSVTTTDAKLKHPWLATHIHDLAVDDALPRRINALIDEQGVVRSNASPALLDIRQQQQDLAGKANRRIYKYLSEGKAGGWIQQDVELALRNGRQVIPVPVAYKRKIRGFVHDHSATGQTAFLEPEEVFELNNRIKELEAEERREIIRILRAFADELRPELPDLQKAYDMLGIMDAIRAKAKLALEMDAMKPQLTDEPVISWVNAKHPLLWLSYKKQNKHVEPLTLELNKENRILVISGPNAGGKSVCLITCGLVQYMLQCGLLAPMDSHSQAGIFHRLFIDIGDEQSLENDLSTYSSHLLNMKYLLERCDEKTLFLIDEFGAGTEPRIGGAIAESILDQLYEQQALGVITTHYANLKLKAGRHPGMVNGSMLFDSKQMKPLFKLKTGIPGSSFAFEIARSIGLPEQLLKKAGKLTGDQDLDFDIQLQDLEVKKAELEEKEKQLKHADTFLAEVVDKYEYLHKDVETRKNEILNQARREAKDILSNANKTIENTIREIKESQADKEKTREARQKLEQYTENQKQALKDTPAPSSKKKKEKKKKPVQQEEVDPTPIKPGDTVKIKGQNTPGEVAELSDDKALVVFDSMKLRIKISELVKLKKTQQKNKAGKSGGMSFDINTRAASFKPDIDLRSTHVDEALQKLQNHIDDAYLLGVPQIRILHGKGDGILRPAIRDFLRSIPHIGRYRDEHPDRGGAGVTIVDFSK